MVTRVDWPFDHQGHGSDRIDVLRSLLHFSNPSELEIWIRLCLWTRIKDIYAVIEVDPHDNHQKLGI